MTLIKSISGIRGTIGGKTGKGLTPVDIVKFTSAYAMFISKKNPGNRCKIAVGRDARVSGQMVQELVVNTLSGAGFDVTVLGLSTTPTVEVAVTELGCQGGIIITASHNPYQWNALKMLNEKGEFISDAEGRMILELAENEDFQFAGIDELGNVEYRDDMIAIHVKKVLNLELVDIEEIKKAGFTVAVDCVNSTGGIALPLLLKELGVVNVIELYCEPTGRFPHNPEPLPEHLTALSSIIREQKADVGFSVDPDVDRLAIVDENGNMFGEEYTLVAVADYILQHTPGNTVSNLSSTRALKDVTLSYGNEYFPAAVGEVNVVAMMKEKEAVIGGEGNGGVIYPALHYGRDALAGIALFLTYLAKTGHKVSSLKKKYPEYYISKNKIELSDKINVDDILAVIAHKFRDLPVNTVDGVKIDYPDGWVHLRKSNTEPIIRVYAESTTEEKAKEKAALIMAEISNITC